MKRAIAFAALISFSLASSCSSRHETSTQPEPGVYLLEDYIGLLEKTRSPAAAWRYTHPYRHATVGKRGDELLISFSSFHEGFGSFGLDTQGKVRNSKLYQFDPSSFQLLSTESFSIVVDRKKLRFRRTEGPYELIQEATITGVYTDPKGRLYSFDRNGNASFPDRSFRYRVEIDMTFSPENQDRFFEAGVGEDFDGYSYSFDSTQQLLVLHHLFGPAYEALDADPYSKVSLTLSDSTRISPFKVNRRAVSLLQAAEAGDLKGVQRELEKHPDLWGSEKELALYWASRAIPGELEPEALRKNVKEVERRKLEVVRYLLSLGISPNVRGPGETGGFALHWAAAQGFDEIVRELIRGAAKVDSRDGRGMTPLMIAVYRGHGDIVRLLVESGADVNSRDSSGAVPLQYSLGAKGDIFAYLQGQGAAIPSTKELESK